MATNLETKLEKLKRANAEYEAAKKKIAQEIGTYAIEKMAVDSLSSFKAAIAPLLNQTVSPKTKPVEKGDDRHV